MMMSHVAKFSTSLLVTDLRMRGVFEIDTMRMMLPSNAKHKMKVWMVMMVLIDNSVAMTSAAVTFVVGVVAVGNAVFVVAVASPVINDDVVVSKFISLGEFFFASERKEKGVNVKKTNLQYYSFDISQKSQIISNFFFKGHLGSSTVLLLLNAPFFKRPPRINAPFFSKFLK